MTYAKLHVGILTSSLFSQPIEVRFAFMSLLTLADQDGRFEGTVDALARRLNMPEENFRKSLDTLMSPDPLSKSQDEDGRRIVSEGRQQYRFVNYAKYRRLMSDGDRRERDRERKRQARKNVHHVHPVRDVPDKPDIAPNQKTTEQADTIASDDTCHRKSLRASDVRMCPQSSASVHEFQHTDTDTDTDTPPPSPPKAKPSVSKPQTASREGGGGGLNWKHVKTALRAAGVQETERAIEVAKETGFTPLGVMALIDHAKTLSGSMSPARLFKRIINGVPAQRPDEGWPDATPSPTSEFKPDFAWKEQVAPPTPTGTREKSRQANAGDPLRKIAG